MHDPTMNTSFSSISFPFAQVSALKNSRPVLEMEKLLHQFGANWSHAFEALLPQKNQGVSLVDLQVMRFSEFVEKHPAAMDFQVFEVQALESLCLWGLDLRMTSVAVDYMFGGRGAFRTQVANATWTPLEQRIRQRIWDSLASAFETPWQKDLPLRLRMLREESLAQNLRMAQPESTVFAAQFEVRLNGLVFPVCFCMPTSIQLESLWSEGEDNASDAVWGPELRHQLKQTPLEAIAVIARQSLTVGELLQMSVGQVIPIQLEPTVDVLIEGRSVLVGRPGVKNDHYALKVEGVLQEWGDALQANGLLPEKDLTSISSPSGLAGAMSDPLESIAEALNGFDQQVAGGSDGQS
jgi:flagellar motor switch protein FliM